MFEEIAKYIIAGLASAAIGVIGYLLKDIRSTLKERLDDHDDDIENIKDDISKFKERLPQQYVLRDDFLRAIANLDNKVDNIFTEMSEINKSLSKLLGVNQNE
jgi:chromosome segregation ATPase